ncbi:EAL domain-containing protein [Acetobacter okinawensis]|uniref:EAL domain-containing protein n=1 Tax=Acetobacter okinawensis TaxID=1076594 RepID=UPI0039E9FBA7
MVFGFQEGFVGFMGNAASPDLVQRLYRALLNTADAVLQASTEREMCDKTCTDLVYDALFQAVWIGRKDESDTLHVLSCMGAGTQGLANLKFSFDNNPLQFPVAVEAWDRQTLVYSNDELNDQKNAPWYDFLCHNQWRSVLAVPIWRGGERWAVISFVSAQTDMFDEQCIGLCQKVSELLGHALDKLDGQKRLEKLQNEEASRARHDPLTGLPNRLALEEYMPQAIARAVRQGSSVAVGMLDLDDFKLVNDGYGHEAGDRLLQTLGRRLQEHVRHTDYVARLGGDEFVIILENLDPLLQVTQATKILDTLHKAVETPFPISNDAFAMVGMTLGLALYPVDGEDPDTLLRRADAAMYLSKQNKSTRKTWWCMASNTRQLPAEESVEQVAFNPYGAEAAELLTQAKAFLTRIRQNFIECFYDSLAKLPDARTALSALAPEQLERLKSQQAAHLDFLLGAQTQRQEILQQARRLGVIHTLCGISPALLGEAYSIYRRLLIDSLDKALLRAYDRYHILLTTEMRLQDDKGAQLEAGQKIEEHYFSLLSTRLPVAGCVWPDVSEQGVEALGRLPGIRAVLLFRMNPAGELVVEHSGGAVGAHLTQTLREKISQPVINAQSVFGNTVTGLAWRTRQQQSCASYSTDPNAQLWRGMMETLGISSSISIPISVEEEQVAVVLALFGAYPNQFETQRMQQFARSLQHRWEQMWLRCSFQRGSGVAEEQSCYIRDRLFSDGLRMYVQPIVNLRTGALLEVEALVRIQDTNGSIIEPGSFLSLLGQNELDRLFHMGLEDCLALLERWQKDGQVINLAINMPPTYLLNEDGPAWVAGALQRYNIQPEQLTVELLETQMIDPAIQDEAIQKFKATGVKIAIDDLGSGYSNLLRLSSLPFDIIKVDQGLLRNIRTAPLQTFSMVKSVLDMGVDFHELVIVEGLEDDDVIEAIYHLGCRYGQGYGISPPMPPEQFPQWYDAYRLKTHACAYGTELVSDLGVLAYHWLSTRGGQSASKHSLHTCLITRWLAAQGLEGSEAAQWHEQCHGGEDIIEASRKFIGWLVKRVTDANAKRQILAQSAQGS